MDLACKVTERAARHWLRFSSAFSPFPFTTSTILSLPLSPLCSYFFPFTLLNSLCLSLSLFLSSSSFPTLFVSRLYQSFSHRVALARTRSLLSACKAPLCLSAWKLLSRVNRDFRIRWKDTPLRVHLSILLSELRPIHGSANARIPALLG